MAVWLRHTVLLVIVVLMYLLNSISASFAEDLSNINETPKAEVELPSSGRTGLDADAISPEKISQFVQVYLQVVDLIEQREGDLEGAETDSESQRLRKETETEALKLIESSGLTLQEYLQLLGLANIDPEFSERIAAQLQEAVY